MIRYPLNFQVSSLSEAGTSTQWKSLVGWDEGLSCAIPREFEGPGGGYSPEDFFALAVANCFVATFKVIAEKSKLVYQDIRVNGELTVDRDTQGRPWMAYMLLKVYLRSPEETHERARRILEKVSQSCLVIQSVKTQVTFEFLVERSL
jgi:organic hydroperoxide reductase OsmC/OhrA